MSRLRSHITFANVVSLLALFLALGGASYAAVQLNGKNLKNRTVAGKKLRRNTVTGKEIRERTLAQVPSAALATAAGHADSAGHADTAGHADSAGHADTASQADDAAAVGGLGLSALVTGGGAAIAKSVSITASDLDLIVALRGFGDLQFVCPGDPTTENGQVRLVNGSGVTVEMSISAIYDDDATVAMHRLQLSGAQSGSFAIDNQIGLIQLQMHQVQGERTATFTIAYRPTVDTCELTLQGLNMG